MSLESTKMKKVHKFPLNFPQKSVITIKFRPSCLRKQLWREKELTRDDEGLVGSDGVDVAHDDEESITRSVFLTIYIF